MKNFKDSTPRSRNRFLDSDEQMSLGEYAYQTFLNGQFSQLRDIWQTVCENLEAKGFKNDLETVDESGETMDWITTNYH